MKTPTVPRIPDRNSRLGLLLLAGLTLFWGANWPAMKIALADFPVWTFRAICLVFGGLGLLLIARLSGQTLRLPVPEIRP